jgi:hypothetical protein
MMVLNLIKMRRPKERMEDRGKMKPFEKLRCRRTVMAIRTK